MTSPRSVCSAALLLAAGCADAAPTAAPTPAAPVQVAEVACRADVVAGSVSCDGAALAPTGARADLVVGGQRTYVHVRSSGITVTDVPDPAQEDTFAFDVSIQNLVPQALGTTDGTSPAPEGVRIFFHRGPEVAGGTGSIGVANEDGQGTFTAGAQPYFQYDAVLDSGDISATRRWKLSFTPGVTRFDFVLLVSAPVQFPDGWVQIANGAPTMAAGTQRRLTALVRDRVGRPIAGETVTWETSAPGSLALAPNDDGSVDVSALTPGTVVLTARTAALPGRPMAVQVVTGPVAAITNLGRIGLNAAPGQLVPDSVVVRVTDAVGNPVSGVSVRWELPNGGTIAPAFAVTRADGTVRGVWTAGATPGTQEARAVLSLFGAIPAATRVLTVAAEGTTRTWTGASATPMDWAEPDNWSPRGLPTALDTVVVTAAATPTGRVPTLSAGSVAGTLIAGGAIALGGAELTVLDSARLEGRIGGAGTLVLRGGTALGGEISHVMVNALTAGDTVRLHGPTRITGSFTLQSGALVLQGQRLRVDGAFSNTFGRMIMRYAADTLSVGGAAVFRSGTLLSAGTSLFQGSVQTSYCTCAYLASGSHVTVLDGTAPQSVQFNMFGSYFATTVVRNPTGVAFETAAEIRALILDPGAKASISAGKQVLVTGNLVLEAGASVLNYGTLDVRGTVTDRSGLPGAIGPNPPI